MHRAGSFFKKVTAPLDVRDMHCYGGIALLAVAGASWFGWEAGATIVGIALFFMGRWPS